MASTLGADLGAWDMLGHQHPGILTSNGTRGGHLLCLVQYQKSEIELFHFVLHPQMSNTWQLGQILSTEFIESKASFLSYGDMAIMVFIIPLS